MKIKGLMLLLVVLPMFKSFAQSNSNEIWVVDLIQGIDKKVNIGTPVRITDNNYYDNQPSFSKDGNKLWFASMPDTTQSDIYVYDLRKKELKQVTKTPESEYQPIPIPFYRDKLSIVRVDIDKGQRLYEIGFDGTGESMLMPNEDSLAYYCWINDTTMAAYMLNGGGGALHQYDLLPQQSVVIMANGGFGRCLSRIPGGNDISFVMKNTDGRNTLMRFDFLTQDRIPLMDLPAGVEDYCWGPDKKVYVGDKGKLLYYDAATEEPSEWKEAADFTKTVGTFYRLAISPLGNKIALVSYKGARP
jgi:hypothetical protein